MGNESPNRVRHWIIPTLHPNRFSDYMTRFARNHPLSGEIQFVELLQDAKPEPGDVINIHRYRRLYADENGKPLKHLARQAIDILASHKKSGGSVVWTVHNLLPINPPPANNVDKWFKDHLLRLVDAVVCHTESDRQYFEQQGVFARHAYWVAPDVDPDFEGVQDITNSLDASPHSVLLHGNITMYKQVPEIIRELNRSSPEAGLTVVGECRDIVLAEQIRAEIQRSAGVVWFDRRTSPEQTVAVYESADIAICHYTLDPPFKFFNQVLHPSSVLTARAASNLIVAPAVSQVRELAGEESLHGYRSIGEISSAVNSAIDTLKSNGRRPVDREAVQSEATRRWEAFEAVYDEIITRVEERVYE